MRTRMMKQRKTFHFIVTFFRPHPDLHSTLLNVSNRLKFSLCKTKCGIVFCHQNSTLIYCFVHFYIWYIGDKS